jgi:hypothetical protein
MSPTEREIKVIALDKILQDRISYINEVSRLEQELKELKEQEINNDKDDFDPNTVENAEIILQEIKDLVPLAEEKIKEIADDLRNILNNDSNEVIDRLLSDADEVEKQAKKY